MAKFNPRKRYPLSEFRQRLLAAVVAAGRIDAEDVPEELGSRRLDYVYRGLVELEMRGLITWDRGGANIQPTSSGRNLDAANRRRSPHLWPGATAKPAGPGPATAPHRASA